VFVCGKALEHIPDNYSIADTCGYLPGHDEEPISKTAYDAPVKPPQITMEDMPIGRKGPLSASTQTWEEQYEASGGQSGGGIVTTKVETTNRYAVWNRATQCELTKAALMWRNLLVLNLRLPSHHGCRESDVR
jgi:hypothetical protein